MTYKDKKFNNKIKMTNVRKLLLIGLILSIVLGSQQTTQAYLYYKSGHIYPSYGYAINNLIGNATYTSAFKKSVNLWNNTYSATGVNIYPSTSSYTQQVYIQKSTYSWYGLYTPRLYSGDRSTVFMIEINSTAIDKNAKNLSNFITSVATHEIGHSLCLADNPPQQSIMRYDVNHNTVFEPQSDDIHGVQAFY